MAAPTSYSAENALPEVLIREENNLIRMEMRFDGALVAPTSGTVTVIDSNNVVIVNAAAVTLTDDGAEFTILAALLPSTLSYSTGWIEQWALQMPDGFLHRPLREAHLRRFRFHNPVTVADLTDEYDDMVRFQADSGTGLQKKLDAASKEVQRRLLYEGKEAALVLSPGALRETILHLAASKIYRNWWGGSNNERYEKLMNVERQLYAAAWARLVIVEDLDVSGTISPEEEGRSGVAVLVTGGNPTWRRGFNIGGLPWQI